MGQEVPRTATCHERIGFVATCRRIPPGWVDAQLKVLLLRARAMLQPCPQKSKGAAFHASPDASATPIAYADTVNLLNAVNGSAGGVQADGSLAVVHMRSTLSRPNRRSRRRRRRNHGWRHCRSRWRGRRRGRRRPSSWRGRRRLSSSKSAPFKRPRHAADIGASGLRRRFFLESGRP